METLTATTNQLPPELATQANLLAIQAPQEQQLLPASTNETFNQGQLFDLRYNENRASVTVAEKVANSINRIGSLAERVSGKINNGANWLKNHRTASQVGEDIYSSAKETYQRGREKAVQAGRMAVASAAITGWYVKERGNDLKGSLSNLVQTARDHKQARVESYRSKLTTAKERFVQKSDQVRAVGRAALEMGVGVSVMTATSAVEGTNNAIANLQNRRAERLFQRSVELAEAADKRKNKTVS